ncbi:uncharacterized protein LOC124291318 isoform X3 [Haliotis rubra]|uniref:uncharacterized protein LOC124291318 isoform X3 n=1 Tax=Haliotis rubra TaxID=36100 RepID=UPI001EE5C360|nr:uncharacterized protein LOC124291318 isoform X3 [Haliotis rubra]
MDPDSPRSQRSLSRSPSSEDVSQPSQENESRDSTGSPVETGHQLLVDSVEDVESELYVSDASPSNTANKSRYFSPSLSSATFDKHRQTNPAKQKTSQTFPSKYGSASRIASSTEGFPYKKQDYNSAFGTSMTFSQSPFSVFSPPATAKVPSTEKSFKTKHGVSIRIYVGDITKVKADAVVTGESPRSSDMSMVTRSLCSLPGGEEFKKKRETRRVSKSAPRDGNVYTVHMKNVEFPFKYVLQAVICPYGDSKSRNWLKTLKKLYRNVYKKADDKDLSRVAIPLLGTGRGRGTAEESIEAAVRTLCRHRPLSLEEVDFVSLDNDINDYFQVICETTCSLSDESSSEDETDTSETDVHPYAFTAHPGPVITHGVYPGTAQIGAGYSPGPVSTHGVYPGTAQIGAGYSPGPGGVFPSTAQSQPKADDFGINMVKVNARASWSDKKSPPQTSRPTQSVAAMPRPEAPVGQVPILPALSLKVNEDVPAQTRDDRIQRLITQSHKSPTVSPNDVNDSPVSIPVVKSLSMACLPGPVGFPLRDSSPVQDLTITEDAELESNARNGESKSDEDSPRNQLWEHVADFTLLEEETEEKTIEEKRSDYELDTYPKLGVETGLTVFDDGEEFPLSPYKSVSEAVAKYGDFDEAAGDSYPDWERSYEDTYSDVDDDGVIAAVEFEPSIDENLIQRGNQPPGTMTVATFDHCHVSGYEDVGIIVITYSIPGGKQTDDHPHPGRFYRGVNRRAFLPDNEMGRKVLRMLEIAFDRKLVFTVGRSLTTGQPDVVKWGHIMHKTSQDGGPELYGYPDPEYLIRVVEDLANLGIVDSSNDTVDDMNKLLDDDLSHLGIVDSSNDTVDDMNKLLDDDLSHLGIVDSSNDTVDDMNKLLDDDLSHLGIVDNSNDTVNDMNKLHVFDDDDDDEIAE